MRLPKTDPRPIAAPAPTWSGLRNLTAGDWPSESAAEEDLLRFLESTKAFAIYRQIPGEPVWKHHFQRFKTLRADLLLLPNCRLVAVGWHGGAIVLEVKRSGEKIGPGLNQLIDYVNAVFAVEGGMAIKPSFGFLFPAHTQGQAVASFMAHQHVGTAMIEHGTLKFWCGETRILSITEAGEIRLGNVEIGRRLGRR